MSKKTEKVEKILAEKVADISVPKNNAKQQKQLLNTIKKSGGDIGMRVRAGEKTKEDKMPNAIYMDNPWGSGRHIDTFENFQVDEGWSGNEKIDREKTNISNINYFLDKIKSTKSEIEKCEDEKECEKLKKYLKSFEEQLKDEREKLSYSIKDSREEELEEEEELVDFEELEENLNSEQLTEAGLPTKRGAQQFKKFVTKAKKGKKDIGDKTKKSKKLANQLSIGTVTKDTVISTYESFLPKHLEDMYFWRDRDSIALNDDNWVKGTKEDFLRPMFKNLPRHKDRYPYDVLRSGKWIETKDGKVVGQIDTMRGTMVTLDIIDDNNEHQYVDFEVTKLIKKIKDCQLKIDSNTTSKNKTINMPWGKIKMKENE